MDYQAQERLSKLKAEHEGLIQGQQTGKACYGESTMGLDRPRRTTLMERVNSRLARAEEEITSANRLSELRELFDKHPDVMRILDLLDVDVRL